MKTIAQLLNVKDLDPPKNTKLFLVWVGINLYGVYDNELQARELESKLDDFCLVDTDTVYVTTTNLNEQY